MSGHRKALIIASDEYEQSGLRQLAAPAEDAEALARVLGDPQIGDFSIEIVHNRPAHVIQEQIENLLLEGRPEDLLLLHFSCHGLKSESGELFFAARNTRPDRLASTAIPADFVQRCMRSSRSRSIVLLLDCCYGGAFAQGVQVRAGGSANVLDSFVGGKLGGGRGRAVITASSAMEYAFEGDRLTGDQDRRPSVFTRAVVDGLASGEADRDEDGWVSLDELYDYVFDKVREQNPNQTPSRDVEMQGDLYLARSRRRRIIPAPLPPDLSAAINDQNMYTRRGAVSELRARLRSDNLSAAAGAWDALTLLANDVSYVAEDARGARLEARIRPAEQELGFGRLVRGSSPPHRAIHLLGPSIARACQPTSSDSWIRVRTTAEGCDVSVDTGQLGTLHGRVVLRGPTGEATVAVVAEIVPPTHGRLKPAPKAKQRMSGGRWKSRLKPPAARVWLLVGVLVALGLVVGTLVGVSRENQPQHGTQPAASPRLPRSARNQYSWRTLDYSRDGDFNQLRGINNRDHIVGYYGSNLDSHGYILRLPYDNNPSANYVFKNGNMSYSLVTGLNNEGVQIGLTWRSPNDFAHSQAFIWNKSLDELAHLPPGCELYGVNDHDIAVGSCADDKKHLTSYLYNIKRNEMIRPLRLSGGTSVTAAAINNSYTVAGYFMDAKGRIHGFVLFRGRWRAILAVRGAMVTEALGVNDAGDVVGYYQLRNGSRHGFIWTRQRKFATVDGPNGGGRTTISGINDRGCLVGFYVKDGRTHGMLATPLRKAATADRTAIEAASGGEEPLCP
jgi:probable HAF family extracellular repeat protein